VTGVQIAVAPFKCFYDAGFGCIAFFVLWLRYGIYDIQKATVAENIKKLKVKGELNAVRSDAVS
jgi:hypothetical protein